MQKEFNYIRTTKLRQTTADLGKFAEAKLREKLPSPIYWIQPDRNVLWNWRFDAKAIQPNGLRLLEKLYRCMQHTNKDHHPRPKVTIN